MTSRCILFAEEARNNLLRGIENPVRAIRSSYGPLGRCTLFHRPPAAPEVLFDGLSITRKFIDTGSATRTGTTILGEALYNLDRQQGDGASTLALVIDEILRRAIKAVAAGHDPGELANALVRSAELAVSVVTDNIRAFSTREHTRGLALTAMMGERILTDILTQVADSLGDIMQIVVREGSGIETTTRILPGMSIDAGAVSPLLRCSGSGRVDVYTNPYVLLVDQHLESLGKLVPILEGFARSDKSLVILARNISGAALSTIIVNTRENNLKLTAIAIPEVSFRVFDVLGDISILTGGDIVSQQTGIGLDSLRPEMLGQLDRLEVYENSALLFGTYPNTEKLHIRRAAIQADIARNVNLSLDKERLELRLARLGGGIGEIHIASRSSADRKRQLILMKKAVNSLKSARHSGVVPGGGVTYRLAACSLIDNATGTGTRVTANRLLAQSLMAPEFALAKSANSGLTALESCVTRPGSRGLRTLDVLSGQLVDVWQHGLLDPAGLIIAVIRQSASVAATLIRTQASIRR